MYRFRAKLITSWFVVVIPDHQFLQINFIGDENRELDQRCAIVLNTRREIIRELQMFFHQPFIQLFQIALYAI